MKLKSAVKSWKLGVRFPHLPSAICHLLLAICYLPSACLAQDLPTEYQVKAVFLEKFAEFVQWPDTNSQSGTNSPLAVPDSKLKSQPIVIGILGTVPGGGFMEALQTVCAQETISGRALRVEQIADADAIAPDGCSILFIAAGQEQLEQEALETIQREKLPVLTVGESADFCARGGIIQFQTRTAQVHFRINNATARAAGLKISSKLLSLAQP